MTPRDLQKRYEQGENVSKILRKRKKTLSNDEEIIEVAYDILTGHYTEMMRVPEKKEKREELTKEITDEILKLCTPTSILEPGVGEGTTLSHMMDYLGNVDAYAFDISWSRVAYARKWIIEQDYTLPPMLFTASMFRIPLPSNSVDVVYTAHSIEPNGGMEEPLISELYRVAKQYLVLVEPAFEFADGEGKKRMIEHRYCTNIYESAVLLGLNVIMHRPLESVENPLNPPAITIIEKNSNVATVRKLVCPQYKTELQEMGGMLYSPEALAVYPIVDGIPCLRIENAITASKYLEIMEK